jgi:hypothetical protein
MPPRSRAASRSPKLVYPTPLLIGGKLRALCWAFTLLLVVEAAVEGVVEPLVGGAPVGLGQGILGFQRVVDDNGNGVRTPPGQHAADRSGEPAALSRGFELGCGLPLRREPGREQTPVPVAGDDAPAVARELVGEVLGIADAEDLRTRPVTEAPGRKGDRGQM